MSALAAAATRIVASPAEGARALGKALRTLALLTLAGAVAGTAWVTWVRDLPVFQVSSVEVVGTDDGLITSTLTGVAREMTTLHVRQDWIDDVAARFPVVREIHAEPSFPTGLRLVVEIREPVAYAQLGDEAVPVAADGTVLPGVHAPDHLPTVAAEQQGGILTGPAADQVRVIGATPAPLLGLIESASTTDESGIAIQLEGGVEVRFGTPAAAERKWAAAAAVLADDTLAALAYINVSAPARPAVGGAVGGPETTIEVELADEMPPAPAQTADPAVGAAETGAAEAPPVPETTLDTAPAVP